jgi:pseudaminic acid biosynthesis-associated methylase
MKKKTAQIGEWDGEFGREYTERNPKSPEEQDALYQANFGLTRTELNVEFLEGLDRSMRILEVGCNVGLQLMALQKMGFTDLHGIEVQRYALDRARELTEGITLAEGSAFDIPHFDNHFDLVFTSGVLIHISPDDIGRALDEIRRCTRQYVWGWEYYAEEYTEVPYRGHGALLWKTDFAGLYRERFPELTLAKERRVKYLDSDNQDTMYLLRSES